MTQILTNTATSDITEAPSGRSFWVVTGYYLAVLLPVVTYAILGHTRFSFWGGGAEEPSLLSFTKLTTTDLIVMAQMLILVFPIASSLISLTGLIVFGPPADRKPGVDWKWNPTSKLLVSYVSRGNQPETLQHAVGETQKVLDQLCVSYDIEVVTDIEIDEAHRVPSNLGQVLYYLVPKEYQTPRGARYKARALQYLLEQRTIRLDGREDSDNVWIMHMDEESILTQECMWGIQKHIEKYDLRRTEGAIGQGEILYNSTGYGSSLLIAAIDAARTGGDLGLFRMQYKALNKPLIGMHGSFVLTPASTEREITWDVGGHGSITEDSYFALLAMERGVKFDWVEGFIREQSPFTVMDIIRQRRRWYCGLSQVSHDPALKFWTTITLRSYVWFWAFSALALPIPLFYLQYWFIFARSFLPYSVFLVGSICTGLYAATYIVGVYRNSLHCSIPLKTKLSILFFSVFAWLMYVPALIECAGTLYGLFFPVDTFYIVKKDNKAVVPTT